MPSLSPWHAPRALSRRHLQGPDRGEPSPEGLLRLSTVRGERPSSKKSRLPSSAPMKRAVAVYEPTFPSADALPGVASGASSTSIRIREDQKVGGDLISLRECVGSLEGVAEREAQYVYRMSC